MMHVLVIGAGGLGCPALLALGEAGVDEITVLEPDRVELSNLHRQVLYTEADIGAPKVHVAARALSGRFPNLRVRALELAFSAQTQALVGEHTWVLDATDGLATKLAIADACVDAGVPFVYAGVVGTDGQVLGVLPGRSACPRCLFDEVPPPGAAPTCAELGIVGPVAGIVAARQVEVGLSGSGATTASATERAPSRSVARRTVAAAVRDATSAVTRTQRSPSSSSAMRLCSTSLAWCVPPRTWRRRARSTGCRSALRCGCT
jgi:adenylyltransferase/sulfurtransferase